MRRVLLAVTALLLFVLPFTSAVSVEDLNVQGKNPVLFGNKIVYYAFEDSIDKDLNNDGDLADHVVLYYDLGSGVSTSTGLEGKNYALFGNDLIVENKAHILYSVDLRDNDVKELKTRGRNPSIFNDLVAFETVEEDVGLDLNNDADTEDTLIRYLFLGGDEVRTTGSTGHDPIVLDDKIVFSVSEGEAGKDLNRDGDLDDSIIHYFDLSTKDVINTRVEGKTLAGTNSFVMVGRRNELLSLDLDTRTTEPVSEGKSPSAHNDFAVFTNNGVLYAYNSKSGTAREIGLAGETPALFDDKLVFVDDKKLKLARAEDLDNDGVLDFFDNCPNTANADQKDSDNDGVGDACEEQQEPVPEQKTRQETVQESTEEKVVERTKPEKPRELTGSAVEEPVQRKPLPQTPQKDDGEGSTYWFLIAVGLTSASLLFYVLKPRLFKKRRQGFGF